MENLYSESIKKIKSLKGSSIDSLTVISSGLECLDGRDIDFHYALCCYFKLEENDAAYKLMSIESDDGYTIFLSEIMSEEYDVRFENLSKSMSVKKYCSHEESVIDDITLVYDSSDLLGIVMLFSTGEKIYFVSGECYGVEGGYELSVSDEMLLIFDSFDAVRKNKLGSYFG